MNEEAELPSSTVYYESFSFRPFEADEMAISPPNYDNTPLVTIRKPSFSGNRSSETVEGAGFKPDVPKAEEPAKRSFSHLLPTVYRSLENLSLIPREGNVKSHNSFTQSLPPSPIASPCSTPHGSPKPSRQELAKPGEKESWNSQLWFYPGFFSSAIARRDNITEDSAENSPSNMSKHQQQSPSFAASKHVSARLRKKTTCLLSNRDLNFLAPTSM